MLATEWSLYYSFCYIKWRCFKVLQFIIHSFSYSSMTSKETQVYCPVVCLWLPRIFSPSLAWRVFGRKLNHSLIKGSSTTLWRIQLSLCINQRPFWGVNWIVWLCYKGSNCCLYIRFSDLIMTTVWCFYRRTLDSTILLLQCMYSFFNSYLFTHMCGVCVSMDRHAYNETGPAEQYLFTWLWFGGMSFRTIAKQTRRSPTTVRKWVRRLLGKNIPRTRHYRMAVALSPKTQYSVVDDLYFQNAFQEFSQIVLNCDYFYGVNNLGFCGCKNF